MNEGLGPKVFSEFQPLEEIIVGRSYPPEFFEPFEDLELKAMLMQIARETEEDLSGLSNVIEDYGAKVRRPLIEFPLYENAPGEKQKMKMYDNGLFRVGLLNPPLFPRDLTLIYGGSILETYSRVASRWFEHLPFYEIYRDYAQNGAIWNSMPSLKLLPDASSYRDYESRSLLFHSANLLKCGLDIFHSQAAEVDEKGRGTKLGLQWIQWNVNAAHPKTRFSAAATAGHLDSRLAFIRPGLLVTWLEKEQLPEKLRSWDIIRPESKPPLPETFQRMRKKKYYKEFVERWLKEWIGLVDETYFDINFISLDENTVIVNSDSNFRKQLESRGINVIVHELRHRCFWDGGLHCMTLDVRRTGGCEDYFS